MKKTLTGLFIAMTIYLRARFFYKFLDFKALLIDDNFFASKNAACSIFLY